MAKKSNNSVIKLLVLFFIVFFISIVSYEYIQYGSIFNNTDNFRKIYSEAIEQKNEENYQSAVVTMDNISPRYEAFDAVLFQQAQCYAKTGNELLVQQKLKSLISKYPQSFLYIPAKYDLAKSYLRAGNFSSAESTFKNIINSHPDTDYGKGSYYYLASINAKKDINTAQKFWLKYIHLSQDGRFSAECAQNIVNSMKDISQEDAYFLGLVFYNSEDFSRAITFFEKTTNNKAWMYLAKANIKLKNITKAKEIIKRGLTLQNSDISLDELSSIIYKYVEISNSKAQAWRELNNLNIANHNLKDIIIFNNAKYLDNNSKKIAYKTIVDKHLKGNYSSEALKLLFWQEYRNKNIKKAKEYAAKHVSNFHDTKSAPEMNYWLGKIYEKEGNNDIALKLYNRILAKYPDDYYAMRAYGRINKINKGVDLGWNLSSANVINKEDFTPEIPYNYSEIKTKFGATLAELLLVEDFDTIDYFHNFNEPFIKSWIYYKKSLRSTSTTTARNAIEEFNEKPDISDKRWQLVYPCYFVNEINKFAQRNKISPYLLISLIREESYFNPLALSSSNAVGLTQILPTTAKEVSLNKGYGQINEFLLFNPETNIKYGAAYFAQIKKQLNNNNLYAVAAYNGGAGAVSSWLKKNNYADLDEFVEYIPYPETKTYVKKVYRSYWNYIKIYSK